VVDLALNFLGALSCIISILRVAMNLLPGRGDYIYDSIRPCVEANGPVWSAKAQ